MDYSDMELDTSAYGWEVEMKNHLEWAALNPPSSTNFGSSPIAGPSNSPPMRSSLGKRSFNDYDAEEAAIRKRTFDFINGPFRDPPPTDNDGGMQNTSMPDASAFSLSPPAAQSTPPLFQQPQRTLARESLSIQKARLSPTDRRKAQPLFAEMNRASFRAPTPPPPSPPAQATGRIIAGMVYNIYDRAQNFLTRAWTWWTTPRATRQTQVLAVETSPTGNKRRAIEADADQKEEPDMKDIPGNFPTPSLVMTPPLSRPSSSGSKEQSPAQQPHEPPMATKPIVEPKKQRTLADICPDLAPKDLNTTLAELTIKLNKKREAAAARKAQEEQEDAAKPYVTSRQRREAERLEKEQRKDQKIDGLISRARLAAQGSPEHQTYRDYRIRLRALNEAHEREEREAELKAEAEWEAEEARKQAEEEARVAAEEAKAAEEARKALDAERAKLIRPLEPFWADKIKDAMNIKNERHVIAKSPEGVELTRRDLGTLLAQPGKDTASAWLNDEVVNAWFATIISRRDEQDGYVKNPKNVPSFVAYNTAWYTTYKNKGVDGLSGWSRRKAIKGEKLLHAEKVFFPINTSAHWMLLIISPKTKTIEFMDSMHNYHPKGHKEWMAVARKWLKMELGNLYKEEEWTESPAKSSLQTNGNDCGAFTCFNALASAKGHAFEEITAEKMQDARRIMGAVLLNGGFKGDFEL